MSEADPTADKCARLTCQSVLARSNTSHMFVSRIVFVVVLFCCCTLRARLKKKTHAHGGAGGESERSHQADGEFLVESYYNMEVDPARWVQKF